MRGISPPTPPPTASAPQEWPPFLLTSSITPVYGNNPSFRVCDYDVKTSKLLDWTVYYTNLTSANDQEGKRIGTDDDFHTTPKATATDPVGSGKSENQHQHHFGDSAFFARTTGTMRVTPAPAPITVDLAWNPLYSALAEYGLADISAASLRSLGHDMLTDSVLWDRYFRNKYAAATPTEIDGAHELDCPFGSECAINNTCVVLGLNADEFESCRQAALNGNQADNAGLTKGVKAVIIIFSLLGAVAVIVAGVVINRRRQQRAKAQWESTQYGTGASLFTNDPNTDDSGCGGCLSTDYMQLQVGEGSSSNRNGANANSSMPKQGHALAHPTATTTPQRKGPVPLYTKEERPGSLIPSPGGVIIMKGDETAAKGHMELQDMSLAPR